MSKNNRKKVYNNSEKAGNNSAFGKVMMTIVILGVVILLFINYALPLLKQSVKKVAAEKTVDIITNNAEKIAGNNPEVSKILDSMTEEDKEAVAQIIENHMDAESVSEVMEYVNEGDKDGLIKYAAENLTAEEISQLMGLYGKYGSNIDINQFTD